MSVGVSWFERRISRRAAWRSSCRRALPLLPALVVLFALAGRQLPAQTSGTVSSQSLSSVFDDDPFDRTNRRQEPDPVLAQAMKKQIRALNVQRQKRIVADTDRLVKLVADLNAGINSREPSRLTAD